MDFDQYITDRLLSFVPRPLMWGTPAELEAISLTMAEMEVLHYAPQELSKNRRLVFDSMLAEIAAVTGSGIQPLFQYPQYAEDPGEFAKVLFEVTQRTRLNVRSQLNGYSLPTLEDPVDRSLRLLNSAGLAARRSDSHILYARGVKVDFTLMREQGVYKVFKSTIPLISTSTKALLSMWTATDYIITAFRDSATDWSH